MQMTCVTREGTAGTWRGHDFDREGFAAHMFRNRVRYGASMTIDTTDHSVACVDDVARRNQGNIGSCLSVAATTGAAILSAQEGHVWPDLSALDLYLAQRDLLGDPDTDSGSYVELALSVLATRGACREVLFPYSAENFIVNGRAVRPNILSLRDGADHRLDAFCWHELPFVVPAGHVNLAALESEIRQDHPVVFGTLLSADFQAYTADQVLDAPDLSAPIGGHAMLVAKIRFRNDRREWGLLNSWGEDFGDNGFVWVTDEFLKNKSAGSFFALAHLS